MDHQRIVFIAGQIGVDHKSNHVLKSLESQTRQALENMESVIAPIGLSRSDIGRCTIFITDVSKHSSVVAIYHSFFEGHNLPPRTIIGVNALPDHNDDEILICIEAVAINNLENKE